MMVIHTKKIEKLNILKENKVVCEVVVKFTSYEESREEETTINSYYSFELNYTNINLDSELFIPFEILTEEIVYKWIEDSIIKKEDSIYKNHIMQIENILNPPPPIPQIIETSLPWT